jgi:hypothetical protein
VLAALNVSLGEVQLAWDFHTASRPAVGATMARVAELAALRAQQELAAADTLPYRLVSETGQGQGQGQP